MAGSQNGFAPDENYQRVFGPLYVQKSYVKKFQEVLPDIPDINLDDLSCQSAVAMLKGTADMLEQAMALPNELMNMAKDLISKPFGDAEKIIAAATAVIGNIEKELMSLLAGPTGVLGQFTAALESLLSCPFLADSPLGKEAAGLLDMIDAGKGMSAISGVIGGFQSQLNNMAREQLNAIKNIPLSKLDNLQSMLDTALDDLGVGEMIGKIDDLASCVASLCNAAEAAASGIKSAGEFLEQLNGATLDKVKGKVEAVIVKATNDVEQKALDMANDMAVLKMKFGS